MASLDGSIAPLLVERQIAPRDADGRVSGWLEPHLVALDVRRGASKLVVFLGGAGNYPNGDGPLLRLLASAGFRAISLRYVHDYPIVDLCRRATEGDCQGRLRLEALEGVDHSPHLDVGVADGIEGRLSALLRLLQARHPAEGWGQFVDDAGPRWTRIVIAGHSHGAATAARAAKARRVHRVVMLSGPYDNMDGAPAVWLGTASATPRDDFFGLTHVNESQHAQHLISWRTLGLGPSARAEMATLGDSHALVTDVRPPGTSSPHIATLPGPWSPKRSDGRYHLEDSWRHLFGPAE